MSLERAKKQLTSIMNTTGTKHPKVLVGELCSVINLLIKVIEQINTSSLDLELLTRLPQEDVNLDPHPSQIPILPIFDPDDMECRPPLEKPYKSPPFPDPNPIQKYRKGNAGDTK